MLNYLKLRSHETADLVMIYNYFRLGLLYLYTILYGASLKTMHLAKGKLLAEVGLIKCFEFLRVPCSTHSLLVNLEEEQKHQFGLT